MTPGNYMGDVHSHPSGDGRSSSNEFSIWRNYVLNVVAPTGRNVEMLAMYVVVWDETSGRHKVFAYTVDSDPDVLGKEINPDAEPCPS